MTTVESIDFELKNYISYSIKGRIPEKECVFLYFNMVIKSF